jgi:hypothetical protein
MKQVYKVVLFFMSDKFEWPFMYDFHRIFYDCLWLEKQTTNLKFDVSNAKVARQLFWMHSHDSAISVHAFA